MAAAAAAAARAARTANSSLDAKPSSVSACPSISFSLPPDIVALRFASCNFCCNKACLSASGTSAAPAAATASLPASAATVGKALRRLPPKEVVASRSGAAIANVGTVDRGGRGGDPEVTGASAAALSESEESEEESVDAELSENSSFRNGQSG